MESFWIFTKFGNLVLIIAGERDSFSDEWNGILHFYKLQKWDLNRADFV